MYLVRNGGLLAFCFCFMCPEFRSVATKYYGLVAIGKIGFCVSYYALERLLDFSVCQNRICCYALHGLLGFCSSTNGTLDLLNWACAFYLEWVSAFRVP